MARARKTEETIAFEDLVEFAKSKEDISTRIVKVFTSNTIAPESVRLLFTHPIVEKSNKDGVEINGEFVEYA